MPVLSLIRGAIAETQALRYLSSQGLQLICKNYRCYHGEIDLVMQDTTTVVFVEVRLRNNTSFGDALCSITPGKIQRLTKAAQHFLQKYPQYQSLEARFDVIGLGPKQKIDWITNAFNVEYGF